MKFGEYFALKGEKDEKKFLQDEPCFFFTASQLKVAHQRWEKLGRKKFLVERDHLARENRILKMRILQMLEERKGLRPLLILWKNLISILPWSD